MVVCTSCHASEVYINPRAFALNTQSFSPEQLLASVLLELPGEPFAAHTLLRVRLWALDALTILSAPYGCVECVKRMCRG